MNTVCTHMIHFTNKGKLEYYDGNYDQFVKTKAEREDNQMKKYNWEQQQIKDMKEYIARFGHGTAKVRFNELLCIDCVFFSLNKLFLETLVFIECKTSPIKGEGSRENDSSRSNRETGHRKNNGKENSCTIQSNLHY